MIELFKVKYNFAWPLNNDVLQKLENYRYKIPYLEYDVVGVDHLFPSTDIHTAGH